MFEPDQTIINVPIDPPDNESINHPDNEPINSPGNESIDPDSFSSGYCGPLPHLCPAFLKFLLVLGSVVGVAAYIYGMYATYPDYHGNGIVTENCDHGSLVVDSCACKKWWTVDHGTHRCSIKLKSWKHAIIGSAVPPLSLVGYGSFYLHIYTFGILQVSLVAAGLVLWWLRKIPHNRNLDQVFDGWLVKCAMAVFLTWLLPFVFIATNIVADENGNKAI